MRTLRASGKDIRMGALNWITFILVQVGALIRGLAPAVVASREAWLGSHGPNRRSSTIHILRRPPREHS
jgi:hypothetical protein